MATARRAFVCFSSAFGRPRSAKTFPELGIIPVLFFRAAISYLYPSSRINSQDRVMACRVVDLADHPSSWRLEISPAHFSRKPASKSMKLREAQCAKDSLAKRHARAG